MARVAPLVNPLMHEVSIRLTAFYVPNRIVWDDWDEYITGNEAGHTLPKVTPGSGMTGWLYDHFGGFPTDIDPVSALPFRAYNMIWNEFFRDTDLQTERSQDDMTLARDNWQRDYFTMARPAPQQGDAVSIPLDAGTLAIVQDKNQNNVEGSGTFPWTDPNGSPGPWYEIGGVFAARGQEFPGQNMGIDINEFRRAMALQRFQEARMRYGDRYVDYLRYLGINPSDGRLSRPEYLGSSQTRISFSEVLQTAPTDTTHVGDMAGHGISGLRGKPWRKMFEEHGYVIVLMSAKPTTQYETMTPRHFLRDDPMDWWQKELEILPWQEVMEHEIFAPGDPTTRFGWVPRYEEYRHNISFVSGEMNQGGTMEDWHMARQFQAPPLLNGSFVECTPTDRVYADKSMPELIISATHDISARRLVGREVYHNA